MKNNFWEKLKKPIYALAPMAGITDSAFRQMCKSFGADVVYSEMVSATALAHDSKKTLELLKFDKKERPFVVQLFGSKPEHFAEATKFITKKIKPDGIDINFGCPVKKVAKQGAGAVLMNNLNLSKKIVEAVVANTDLPVSVKCRAYVGRVSVIDFLKKISARGGSASGGKDLPVAAVMIHGRTMTQGHSGEVDYKIIKEARKFFKGIIIANGGVGTTPTPPPASQARLLSQAKRCGQARALRAGNPSPVPRIFAGRERGGAREYAEWLLAKTGADGVGIAQGALGRPWIFKELRIKNYELRIKEEIFRIVLKHARLAHKLKGKQGIVEMRKHLCWYVAGMPGASEMRRELVQAESLEEIKKILK